MVAKGCASRGGSEITRVEITVECLLVVSRIHSSESIPKLPPRLSRGSFLGSDRGWLGKRNSEASFGNTSFDLVGIEGVGLGGSCRRNVSLVRRKAWICEQQIHDIERLAWRTITHLSLHASNFSNLIVIKPTPFFSFTQGLT